MCVVALRVRQHLAAPQLGPNGGLIAHCLLSSAGPVVPAAIWMLLAHCLSHTPQLWDEAERSVKEIKIDDIKRLRRGGQGEGGGR